MKTHSILVALFLALTMQSRAATLQDFGYEHITVNGEVAKGHRPLLVILANFAGARVFAHDANFYDNFVFNFFAQPGLNNYFMEVSDGRFFWSRGGTVTASLPSLMLFSNFTASLPQGAPLDQLYASNIIHQTMLQSSFNFAGYDDNNDGTISQHELQIVIISNDGDYSGANRWAGCIRPGGSTRTVCAGSVALLNHQTDFATFCHEFSHSLGTKDLYGVWAQECLSEKVTLMSCTIAGPEVPDIYHLDPWHKLQLGWVEPRIFSITAGGYATVPAAQVIDTLTPLLLHDPAEGPGEFFMLEYRARNRSAGALNDSHTSGDGLAIWRVKQEPNHEPSLVLRQDAGNLPAQTGWRWCPKCRGLHHIGNPAAPTYRPCPPGAAFIPKPTAGDTRRC